MDAPEGTAASDADALLLCPCMQDCRRDCREDCRMRDPDIARDADNEGERDIRDESDVRHRASSRAAH